MERRNLLVGVATSAVSAPTWAQLIPIENSRRPRPPDDPAASRFARAREFASGLDPHVAGNVGDFLYRAGIVSQLGVTAYLFDQGLDDAWCRKHIGLDVAKALAFANHLGLGCDCDRIAELARLLSPYGRWRRPSAADLPDAAILSPSATAIDVARLLERVEQRMRESDICAMSASGN